MSIGSSEIQKYCTNLVEFSGKKGGMNTIYIVIGLIILCCCCLSSSAAAGWWFYPRNTNPENTNQ